MFNMLVPVLNAIFYSLFYFYAYCLEDLKFFLSLFLYTITVLSVRIFLTSEDVS